MTQKSGGMHQLAQAHAHPLRFCVGRCMGLCNGDGVAQALIKELSLRVTGIKGPPPCFFVALSLPSCKPTTKHNV